jgi:WD40 repeat protein
VVEFHPNRNVILAGGDDGLVSLFDTTILEEEDSLIQAINHGPIHKAGFLGDHRLYALSSDPNLAVHPVATAGDEQDPEPTLFGDLRPIVPCQYVIDVQKYGGDIVVAGGTSIE